MCAVEGKCLKETAIITRSITLCIEHLKGVPRFDREEIKDIVKREQEAQKMRRKSREEEMKGVKKRERRKLKRI
ncbi:hypothetical protein PRIPAC_70817 [Pristionchus pacificus]|uniref:Uncharacterized protein n=1 Tax=Pristionchus pacificus TaxID=54126 RepID=A0A2A6CAQ9_PRIPA|nr:hypothetical protein PRIPAC_70817 [Pristionchus pacificus]|eukprot:PDM75180.1 hypothetical protein PRIPAC_40561 [Pristionchus pacificus]